MKNKKQKITLAVDKEEISDKEFSGTIFAHKEISDAIKSAYQFPYSDIKMKYLAERVIAESKSKPKVPALQKIKEFWLNTFSVHRLAWSAALSIIVVASFGFVLLKKSTPEPQYLESFVIFQTQEGDSIVRYFNYKSVKNNEKI